MTDWGLEHLLEDDIVLAVNARGNLMAGNRMIAEVAFPTEVVGRRFIQRLWSN